MDKHLNEQEEKLFDLIEQKDFKDLTEAERALVVSLISEEEYKLRRSLIVQVPVVFEDEDAVPLPLAVPVASTSVWKKPIPLYQVIITAAAIFLLMFYVIPRGVEEVGEGSTEYIVQTDTIEVETRVVDTVIQTIEKPVFIEKEVYVQENTYTPLKEEPRLLISGPSAPIYLNQEDISTKGTSMTNDETTKLLPDIPAETIGMNF